MRETVLIHFSGHDHPGQTTLLTGILAEYDACILDIGQAVVHETLALGLLIEVPEGRDFAPLKAALIEKSQEIGLHVRFTPISEQALQHWLATQGKDRFVITVLGRAVSALQLARVSAIIAAHRLEYRPDRAPLGTPVAGRPHGCSNACVELEVSGQVVSEDGMRADFLAAAQDLGIDIAFQRESIYRRNRRLFAFDMDSTLIQGEVIDELARMAGVADQVVAITESAMRGEIEFKESFRRRVGLLKGLPEARVRELIGRIPLAEGAEQLIRTLKVLGYKTAILSGGFTFFARHLQERFGIDYVHANELEIEGGMVTGRVSGRIIDGAGKADASAADRGAGEDFAGAGGGGRRRSQRPAHAQPGRHGHRLPREAPGATER